MKAVQSEKKKQKQKTEAEMVVGIEDELALCAFSPPGVRMVDSDATVRLIDLARQHLRYLPLAHREVGVALPNGSFLYQDVSHGGAHSEICTAECLDPKSVVIAREAGFANVKNLCEKDPATEWRVFRHCVDPISGSSWATHCSVDTNESFKAIVSAFVPFVVSKLIFAGSGGFSETGAFTIAPRLSKFRTVSGTNTEAERPLVCTRKKPVINRMRRQEFICHEALRSHLASLLDYGTTMLVMTLVNHGINPGGRVALDSPIEALQLFSDDPECKVRANGIEPGRSFSALELQYHYLDEVETRLAQPWMPQWAGEIVTLWRETLDLLAHGPEGAADRLDWCIKLQLFRGWNEGERALKKNPNLMELDIRFGEMERGIFDQLDQSGLLSGHHVAGINRGSIGKAIVTPPPTRAELRGSWINDLSGGEPRRYFVNWDSIIDTEQERHLSFQDRFSREPVDWGQPGSEQRTISRSRSRDTAVFGLGSVLHLYDKGRFHTALRILDEIESRLPFDPSASPPPYEYFQYRSWISAKLGFGEESLQALKRLFSTYPERESALACDHVLVLSSLGMLGASKVDAWIEIGVGLMDAGKGAPDEICPFYTHSALRRLRTGDNREAREFLERALEPSALAAAAPHTIARAHTLMGEWHRLEGQLDEAEEQLQPAERLYRDNDFRAEYADFYLATKAKLAFDLGRRDEAVAMLNQASELQAQLGIPGQIRSELLLARIQQNDTESPRDLIEVELGAYPSIASCPILHNLLKPETWKKFMRGENQPPWLRAI